LTVTDSEISHVAETNNNNNLHNEDIVIDFRFSTTIINQINNESNPNNMKISNNNTGFSYKLFKPYACGGSE